MVLEIDRRLQAAIGHQHDPARRCLAGLVAAQKVAAEAVDAEIRHRFLARVKAEEVNVDQREEFLAGDLLEMPFELRAGQTVPGAALDRGVECEVARSIAERSPFAEVGKDDLIVRLGGLFEPAQRLEDVGASGFLARALRIVTAQEQLDIRRRCTEEILRRDQIV